MKLYTIDTRYVNLFNFCNPFQPNTIPYGIMCEKPDDDVTKLNTCRIVSNIGPSAMSRLHFLNLILNWNTLVFGFQTIPSTFSVGAVEARYIS